jgi:hypothetical protein
VDQVPLDDDVGARVAVNAVGVVLVAFSSVLDGADVVDGVPANFSVPSIIGSARADSLTANGVDSDIVVIVDDVVRNREIRDVAIDIYGFTVARLQAIDCVPADYKAVDGGGFRTIGRDPEGVAVLL